MAIPTSTVVSVSLAIGAQFPSREGFGTLAIVTNEPGPLTLNERARSYANIEGVTTDWPGTEALKAATSYFSQQPKPTSLVIARRFNDVQSASLFGGSVTDLAAFTPVTNGTFNLTVDTQSGEFTAVDTSGASDLPAVAAILQTAIRAEGGSFATASCMYSDNRFIVISGTTGASSTISFATEEGTGTDLSALLRLQQGQAIKSNGIDAETITASLNAIEAANSDWYGLMFTNEVRDDASINSENAVDAAATWIEARTKVFFNTTNDLDTFNQSFTTDIGSVLNGRNLRRTITTIATDPSQYPSASVAGRAFTVNFNQANSTLTLKFKTLPGITVEQLNINDKDAIDSKNVNAFINVGGTSIYAESTMADGTFFDEVHGTDWLQNAVQTNVFGYLVTQTTKVPYTDKGAAALEQQVIRALDEAVLNGLIAPGTTIDGEFLGTGYRTTTVPVANVNPSDKSSRIYNGISFVALGAGAIHGVQISGVFER